MKQFGLAIHNSHDSYQVFSPSRVDDGASWYVYLLPFLEPGTHYDRFDYSHPRPDWSAPEVTTLTVKAFTCPTRRKQRLSKGGDNAPGGTDGTSQIESDINKQEKKDNQMRFDRRTGVTRRDFLGRWAAVSAAAMLPRLARGEETLKGNWAEMLEDPVRKLFPGQPDLDRILTLFPRTTGEPAFDPALIARNIKELRTNPPVKTGHPFLDLSVQTGLAHIDATFQGDHPKYGVQVYGQKTHDGFPPTIIAAVDALSAWGMHERAAQLFRYWLTNFVRDDGTINYYGPSLSEYGQLLHTAALLEERAGLTGWWQEGFGALDRMAEYLLRLRAAVMQEDGLLSGVPEADTRKDAGKYFHNNAWVAKGLTRWADLCQRRSAAPSTPSTRVRQVAVDLAQDTLRAIRQTWPTDPSEWWLPPKVGPLDPKKPSRLNGSGGSGLTAYTNYRYWPELLSSGVLPHDMANRIVEARLSAAGQFCGMTRFSDHLDDWPLADYLAGLWALGRKNDFLLSLYGHVAYHQAEGHLTAYEQVSFPPGKKRADYCLPCQLVAARAARLVIHQ